MRLVRSDVIGRTLRDRDGRVVGKLTDFYEYPPGSGDYWGVAEVAGRGRLRLRPARHLVDLTNSQLDGAALVAAHPMAAIRGAPRVLVEGTMTAQQASSLIAHYWPSAPA
jgi:homospermidine synthase